MAKRKTNPKANAAPLIFQSLDVCDGCGTKLAPGRLSGLCPACLALATENPLDTRKKIGLYFMIVALLPVGDSLHNGRYVKFGGHNL